jgi:hypothetical protein
VLLVASMALLSMLQGWTRSHAALWPATPAVWAFWALVIAAAAGGAVVAGHGSGLVLLSYLVLWRAGRSLQDASPILAAVAAGVAAACLVELGSLIVDGPRPAWLLPATASLAVFGALARRRAAAVGGGLGRVKAPQRLSQAQDLLLVLMFGTAAAGQFALLSDPVRVNATGYAMALLPYPFLLVGLVGCIQPAFGRSGATRLPSLADRTVILAALGWIAAALAPSLPVLLH